MAKNHSSSSIGNQQRRSKTGKYVLVGAAIGAGILLALIIIALVGIFTGGFGIAVLAGAALFAATFLSGLTATVGGTALVTAAVIGSTIISGLLGGLFGFIHSKRQSTTAEATPTLATQTEIDHLQQKIAELSQRYEQHLRDEILKVVDRDFPSIFAKHAADVLVDELLKHTESGRPVGSFSDDPSVKNFANFQNENEKEINLLLDKLRVVIQLNQKSNDNDKLDYLGKPNPSRKSIDAASNASLLALHRHSGFFSEATSGDTFVKDLKDLIKNKNELQATKTKKTL